MNNVQVSSRLLKAWEATSLVGQFLRSYIAWQQSHPDGCDFASGNPQEMPPAGFVEALQKSVVPTNKEYYAYTFNHPDAQQVVSQSLQQQFDRPYAPDDIFLTNGASGALQVAFSALLDLGDEAIFITPPWFFYESMILNAGAVPVRAKIDADTYDLDLDSIEAAITDKTRFVMVNSPNNPTGKIYPPETLRQLGGILTAASAKNGRTIYLLSDEAYRRILFDGNSFTTPTSYYPASLMIYTYAKTMLTPGQRMGYIAASPEMPDAANVKGAIFAAQVLNGFATMNSLLQHGLAHFEPLSIDVEHLQQKRDRLLEGLRQVGYEVATPEATFYLMPRLPMADDVAFAHMLADAGLFCLPGTVVEMPGHVRLSATASDDMVERGIEIMAAVRQQVLTSG
jgi:aspartate aminotransferase